jgi:hypothetical protein
MAGQSAPNMVYPETADIETSSSDYARRFSGKVGEYFLDVQTKTVLNMLEPWSGARVLDVGGGHAQVAVPLVKKGFSVTVSGSSEECRNRLDAMLDPGSFEFVNCDMLSLPFEDNSFDIILAFRLLPHVNQWQRLISEMCRVASKAIIVDYPDIRSFNFMSKHFFKAKKAIEGNTRPFRCFTRGELFWEFERHGFVYSYIYPEFFVPMVLHRTLGSVPFSRAVEFCSRLFGFTHFLGSPVILRLVSEAGMKE